MSNCPYKWATPPEPVPDAQITARYHADVIVIGAGFSGITTALSAAENGLSVMILEKGADFAARGLHIGVANSRYMRERGIVNDIDELRREFIKVSTYRANEEVLQSYLVNSEHAMNWLLDKTEKAGLDVSLNTGYYRGWSYREFPGTHQFKGGVEAVVRLLLDLAVAKGVRVLYNAPACQLVKENGRVYAAIARTADGYIRCDGSRGVVLATGDISGNKEMVADLAPEGLHVNCDLYTPAGRNTGDGHRMGLWAGGTLQDTPFPCMTHTMAFGSHMFFFLSVNQAGRRYMNEDASPQNRSCYTWNQDPEHPWGYAIMDSRWPEQVAESMAYGGGMFWDWVLRDIDTPFTTKWAEEILRQEIEGGEISFKADSLQELAGKIGVPCDPFLKTVQRYNDLVYSGHDTDFGKRRELLTPLNKPPYYAVKFGPALLTIPAGLNIDVKLRVQDENRRPVPGLYAVGNASGSIYAVDYPLTIPGNDLGRCLTWGYLCGKALAED